MGRRPTLPLGLGLAAAAAAGAVGLVADHVVRERRTAIRLGTDLDRLRVAPDHERVVVACDGVPLHVEIDDPAPGSAESGAPTAVLVHGYTHSLELWTHQRRALSAAGCRVVVYDQRGHGRSAEGEDASYSLHQLGADLRSVIAATTLDGPVILAGHSMGGMALMTFAQDHPELLRERVVGAAFVSTSAGDLGSLDFGLGRQLGAIVHRLGPGAIARLGTQQGIVDRALRAGKDIERYLVDYYSFGSPVPMATVVWTADMIFHTRMHVMSAYLTELTAHDGCPGLEQYAGLPALVMHGADDRITPRAHGDAVAAALPGCEYVVVEHAGHVLPLEHPDRVNQELLRLVRRAGAAPSAYDADATAGVR